MIGCRAGPQHMYVGEVHYARKAVLYVGARYWPFLQGLGLSLML